MPRQGKRTPDRKSQVRSADTDKEDSQVDDVGDPAPRERGEHEVLGGNLGVVDGPDVPGLGNAAGNRGGDAGELEHGEQERNLEHAQAVDNGEGDRADTENGQRATEQAERRADSKDDGQQQGAGGDDGDQALLEEDGVAVVAAVKMPWKNRKPIRGAASMMPSYRVRLMVSPRPLKLLP